MTLHAVGVDRRVARRTDKGRIVVLEAGAGRRVASEDQSAAGIVAMGRRVGRRIGDDGQVAADVEEPRRRRRPARWPSRWSRRRDCADATRPPSPPWADDAEMPLPGGGEMVRSETPPGPSSSSLPAGFVVKLMYRSCVPPEELLNWMPALWKLCIPLMPAGEPTFRERIGPVGVAESWNVSPLALRT